MTRPNFAFVTPSVRVCVSAAALTVAVLGLSACGATSNFAPREGYTPPPQREPARPNFPITAPARAEPAPQDAAQATAPAEAAPQASPTVGISSQPLPPPPAAVQQQDLPPPPPPSAPPVYYTPPAPTPAPVAAPAPRPAPVITRTTVTTVTGKVVEIAGKPAMYTIRSGDTLTSIARKLDTTQKALAEDNNLEPPYALRPGRLLKGPAVPSKAYVVGQGDTLYAIAQRFKVTPPALAAANGLRAGAAIRGGQRLELPDGFRDTGPVRTTVTTTAPATSTMAAAATPPTARSNAYAPVSAPETMTATSTSTLTSVTGRVVDGAGKATTYRVKKGDTLTAIADKLDTTQKQLIDDNDLKKPYRLRPGMSLKGPSTRTRAYVAGEGDTLRAVAQRFSVTTSALAAANNLRVAASIRSGQHLELPKGYRDTGPIRTTTTTRVATPAAPPSAPAPRVAAGSPPPAAYAPPRVATTTPPATTAYAPPPASSAVTTTTTTTTAPPRPGAPAVTTTTTTIRPAAPPAASLPTETAALSDADIAAAGRGRFTWPVRGPVLSAYGPKGTGQRNDGLDLQASAGSPVMAAASGEVVYAGDQVPGFGNLVLVKHDGGWVTAYAHLARADVKMRQTVAQGQQIGSVGSTGGVPEPQLHFEVRYAPSAKDKARPIDPALVLPR